MSHFSVAIHVPAEERNLIFSRLEDIMAPWQEYGGGPNSDNGYVYQVNITEDVVKEYFMTRDMYYNPNSDKAHDFRTKYSFLDKELERRVLSEKEVEAYQNNKFITMFRDIRVVEEPNKPITLLSIPREYKSVIAGECHAQSFADFVRENWGIETIVDNISEAPETGSYVYIPPDVNIGPFDIETTFDELIKLENSILNKCRVFSYTNPNAKWDWWTTEGRYEIEDKEGRQCNICRIEDINFCVKNLLPSAEHAWDLLVKSTFELLHVDGNTEEGYSNLPTRESYIQNYCRWRTHAYVKDGEWHEPGRVGWFGCCDETEESRAKYEKDFDRMIESCSPDDWLLCVDCHI